MKLELAIVIGLITLHGGCSRARMETQQGNAETAGAAAPQAAQSGPVVDPGGDTPEPVTEAVAVLHPTAGSAVQGVVRFERQQDGQIDVRSEVTGLPPGPHAYHVHLYGDCSGAEAKTAGTHFNFQGSSEHPPEDIQRITGDLGELSPGADGKASADTTLEAARLLGPYSIIGRSVIVHEQGNDPSQPPIGGAGGRLACGVIGIAEHQ